VGIFEKSSRLRIARFSLGMITPEPRRSGAATSFVARPAGRLSLVSARLVPLFRKLPKVRESRQ